MKKLILLFVPLLIISASVFSNDKPVLTVLDFRINSISESDMKSITSFLSASLHDAGEYTVIDTAQRDTILDELAFSNSGCTDESCMLEIGKLLSAQFIVTGDIALLGGRYIFSAKMIETETSATIHTAKNIYPDLGELIDDMPNFAARLSGLEAADTQTAAAESGSSETAGKTEAAEAAKPATEKPAKAGSGDGDAAPAGTKSIVGWSLLGGGTVIAGVGTYFLIDSIMKINDANDAWSAYDSATAGDADYDSLYSTYAAAYTAAENSNTMFWVGAGLAGGGVLTALTSLFFFGGDSEPAVDTAVSILPGPKATVLSFGFSY